MSLRLDVADRPRLATAHAEAGGLVDDLTGSFHRVTPRGEAVLDLLDGTRTWRQVLAADPDAGPIVEHLAEAGLLRVRRHWPSRLHPATWPAIPPPLPRRHPATALGAAAAVLVAGWPLLALAAGLGLPLLVVAPSAAALVPSALVLAGLATTVAHELGHVAALRRSGMDELVITATPGRIAVRHPAGAGRAVAAAGPAAGAVAALVVGATVAALSAADASLALLTAGLGAAGHLAALHPAFADGRRFWGRTAETR